MSPFRHGKPVKKRKPWKVFILLFITMLALSIGGAFYWYSSNLRAVDSANSEVIVFTVEPGASESEVADALHTRGLIKSPLVYVAYTRISGSFGSMQAGSYKLLKSMSVKDIVSKITKGEVAVDLLTILPAQRIDELRAAFVASGYSVDEVDDALDPAKYADHPALRSKPPLASLEGYLYPESFQRTSSTKLETIIRASLDEMAMLLTQEVEQKLSEKGLSLHEGVIFASIVEKEVSNNDDKPTVAQVFLKRYEIGMTLGSDVTAYYGAEIAGIDRTVSADTPYNTRLYPGLPPGPISNITASSIKAVIEPSSTDYLFFVAGDDGITYFSRTLEEHEALTAQHCIVLCAIP